MLEALIIGVSIAPALSAPTASAAVTHNPEPFSPLDGSAANQALTEASGIAIDETSGNIFVTNGTRISILGSEGGAPVGLAPPYEIPGVPLGNQPSLAYDNSVTSPARGTLYIYDSETETVKRYVRNANSRKYEAYGFELGVASPFIVHLSVDAAGNLYVSNRTRVQKYTSAGLLDREYDLSHISIDEEEEGDVAADAIGNLFLGSSSQVTGVLKFPTNSSGEPDIEHYTKLTDNQISAIAIDTTAEHLYAAYDNPNGGVGEFDTPSGLLVDEFGAETINTPGQLALNSATERIYLVDANTVDVFGPPVIVPTLAIGPASEISGTKATLNGTIDPQGLAVSECFFEWEENNAQWEAGQPNYAHRRTCEQLPPADSEQHQVSGAISGLRANGTLYHFRLVAKNANGVERTADQTLRTLDTVTTQPATDFKTSTAVLNGTLRPEGLQYTSCVFEWGLTTNAGFENVEPCNPPAQAIGPDFSAHSVSANLTGLTSNTTYKFRLSASNSSGNLKGGTATFTTIGAPLITEVRASQATHTSVTLEAAIDPRGFGTTYRFEWGMTTGYGHRLPAEFDPFAGSGTEELRVNATIAGLSPGTAYHYRVIATNSSGSTATPDHVAETVDDCGLPDSRCFELVSPHDVGPTDLPGQFSGSIELHFQAAEKPGGLAYVSETGPPSATKGSEVLSKAVRGPDGWMSSQISPPLLTGNGLRTEPNTATSSSYSTLNEDLSCGVVSSTQALTHDLGSNLTSQLGGVTLYRQNVDGSYTAVTPQTPTNISKITVETLPDLFAVRALSKDCTRIVFESPYTYPGVQVPDVAPNAPKLYEWEEGSLRSVSYVPSSSSETLVAGTFDGASRDGRYVAFSTNSGIFVREDGLRTREVVSASSGSDPAYQYISSDGQRLFFTARAGLTAQSSVEGRDLYEYRLDSGQLTDLSPSSEQGGAAVYGFIGASEGGTHVYFLARGQLLPGKGATLAENEANDSYSIYSSQGRNVNFVGTFRNRQAPFTETIESLVVGRDIQTAQVSASGRFLLFESIGNLTGYEAGNTPEAYLYDAEAPTEALTCISCPADGHQPDPAFISVERLSSAKLTASEHSPRTLVERDGQPTVIFSSFDVLAPGGTAGETNLYEWTHDQVFLIAAEPLNFQPQGKLSGQASVAFASASADGTDLFVVTPQTLNWEDGDSRSSVYDARVDGGFSPSPAPAAPCDATEEDSCQGHVGRLGDIPSPTTSDFNGTGNQKHHRKKHHRKKHHRKKHHRKKHHRKKHHRKKKQQIKIGRRSAK